MVNLRLWMSLTFFSLVTASCYKATESKEGVADKGQVELTNRGAGSETQKIGGSGSSTCACQTTQNSCKADCFFSDCCVCWNYTQETGACGCYFGIAKCSTAAIGKQSRVAEQPGIKFYPDRFSVFLDSLKSEGFNIAPLAAAFADMMPLAERLPGKITTDYVMIPGASYEVFYARYHAFMEGLSLKGQQWVLGYLHGKSTSK